MQHYVLALLLAGCTRQPTVPGDMYNHISPEDIERVAPLEDNVSSLETRIESVSTELESVRSREAAQAERLDAARDSVDANRRLKELAVGRSDPEAAEAADQRNLTGDTLYGDASSALAAATSERMRLEAELALLEAERDLQLSYIERERARSVSGQVEGFDMRPYDRAVKAATKRRDSAAQEAEQVGVRPAG